MDQYDDNCDYDKDVESMLKNVAIVRTAIREKHPEGKEFITGEIECPLCKKGTVKYMISDHYNGHIHGVCSEGCVDWIE